MKNQFKLLAMAATLTLGFGACSSEDVTENLPSSGKTPVEFTMTPGNINTKTAMTDSYVTSFEEGDAVGIFAYTRAADGSDEALMVTNAKYVLGADGNWTAENEANAIYADDAQAFNYYAYYPYQADATNPAAISLTVAADQTQGFTDSDALMANNKTVAAGETKVTLSYKHAFTLVQVNLGGSEAVNTATVKLTNVFPTAALNLTAGSVGDASGTAGEVQMWAHADNATAERFIFRAIVPAQEMAAGARLAEVSNNGTRYGFTYDATVPYEENKLRVFNIVLGEQEGTITIPATDTTIENWGTSEEVEGNGSSSELVDPITTPFTLPFADAPFTSLAGAGSAKIPADAASGWYHRESSSKDPSLVPTFSNNTLVLTNNTNKRGSWNNASVVYHIAEAFEAKAYKVTLNVTGTTGSEQVGITATSSDDSKMFRVYSSTGEWGNRSITTFGSLTAEAATKTFYIDLGQTTTENKSSGLENTDFTAATASDVEKGINIYLYNYTAANASAQTVVTINSVTLDREDVPTPAN